MTDLHVRRFEPGDGERVRELNDLAMATTPEYEPDVPDEDLDDVGANYLDTDGCEFLVGSLDGVVVATTAYTPIDGWKAELLENCSETAELTRMRVAPDVQGRGIGTAMYEALERRARSDGYKRFVLDTGVENDRARGFYEALGFECVRERTVSFADGELTFDLAVYRTAIDRARPVHRGHEATAEDRE